MCGALIIIMCYIMPIALLFAKFQNLSPHELQNNPYFKNYECINLVRGGSSN